MLHDDGGGLVSLCDLVGSQLCSACIGPEAKQMTQIEQGSVCMSHHIVGRVNLQQVLDVV